MVDRLSTGIPLATLLCRGQKWFDDFPQRIVQNRLSHDSTSLCGHESNLRLPSYLDHFVRRSKEAAQACVERFDLHVLECTADSTDVLCLLSLRPTEPVASAVSKLKGQVSKWLRKRTRRRVKRSGCSAADTSPSPRARRRTTLCSGTSKAQGQHHGYDDRWAKPPVLVQTFEPFEEEEHRLQQITRTRCCGCTLCCRPGVSTGCSRSRYARVVTAWQSLEREHRFALKKVSFVPDHVHVAVRVHPAVSPAELVCHLMNHAQGIVEQEFRRMVSPSGIDRLWQPSAYVGSYGDLASAQVSVYLRRWQSSED